jgi:hypothetical protein
VLFLFPDFPNALTDRFVYSGKPQLGRFAVNRYQSREKVSVKTAMFLRTPPQFAPLVLVRRAQPVRRR